MSERVLITGGGGQLASDLERQLADRRVVAARSRAELDVADSAALERAFAEVRPDLVVNCAAFHNVDVCEHEEVRSFEVNATAVGCMARLCAARGARFVHLSTNYVFDGERNEPYGESDCPSPRSVYSISKLAGEYAALAYAPGALVVRTAGLYGEFGSASKGGNFITRILARAREQGELDVVADQFLSPTFTADLAVALIEAVEAGTRGIVHLTASGGCSWHEFTQRIMELAGVDAVVNPSRTTLAPAGAQRPLNGLLARPRADALGLTPLPAWDDELERYMTAAGLVAARA